MTTRIVLVSWIDSCSTTGWHSNLNPDPATCESIGWLVHSGTKTIMLAASRDCGSSARGDHITIPRACVTHIRTLKAHDPACERGAPKLDRTQAAEFRRVQRSFAAQCERLDRVFALRTPKPRRRARKEKK